MKRNLLITFEGIDGCGKSTQAVLLRERLESLGIPVRLFREPGGTAIGEKVRSILLDPAHGDMSPLTELFLYLAARSQITAECILPALRRGETVIMDRYIDSTAAYQGYARGLGLDRIRELNFTATGGLVPDITFLVDCDVSLALSRLSGDRDRLEAEGEDFFRLVREGFLAISRCDPERVVVCDGSREIPDLFHDILSMVAGLLSRSDANSGPE